METKSRNLLLLVDEKVVHHCIPNVDSKVIDIPNQPVLMKILHRMNK